MRVFRKILAFVLATTLLLSVCVTGISAAPGQTRVATLTEKTADPTTYGLARDAAGVSTKYNGSLWADKSVSATMDIYSDIPGIGDYELADDELEVALSAVSQTFPISTTTQTVTKKANIVFAIDVSTSMTKNNLMVDGVSRSRLWVLRTVAQGFVDTLDGLNYDENGERTDEYDINISIVLYAGQGSTYQLWTPLNETTIDGIKNKLANVAIPTASTCTGATAESNTNTQAGAYMARLMYSDEYATQVGRPANYADKTTNNFTIFMTDGAPNRYYVAGTDEMGSIPVGYDATHKIYYTVPNGITRNISATDFKVMAAYKQLEQAEAMKHINNSVVFSLGLGEWFTDNDETSGFPTATYLCQLMAAVGNGTYDPSNGEVITAEYALEHYIGYDVPDGAMPGSNPYFPDIASSASNFGSNSTYTYNNNVTTVTFSSMQALIDAMNLPNATDTFVTKSGATVTKESAFYRTVDDSVIPDEYKYAQYTTIDACGIPYVPDDVLSQVVYYYAGNTATKFATSMQDIVTAIETSFGNHVTAITNFGDPRVDGLVKIVDTIGEGMELRKFLGVVFNNRYYSAAPLAEVFANYDEHVWTPADSEAFDSWCKQMQYVYGAPITRQTMEMLIHTSVAGGTTYYNSPTDFKCELTIYGKYIPSTGAYQYVGPYYNADGTAAPVPAGATHTVHQYLVTGTITDDVLIDENVSLMYLQMAHVENLTTGTESVIMNVPAALIPIRTVITTDGFARLVTDPMPISMVYTVGLKANLTTQMLEANASVNAQGETVHTFYTNGWKTPEELALNDAGTTYATFTANPMNPYYHATENIPLYVADQTAADGYRAATTGDTGAFYLRNEYADTLGTSITYQEASECFGTFTPLPVTDANGTFYYVPDGTLRHDDSLEQARIKTANTTQTNPNFYDSEFSTNDESYTDVRARLGNNGKLVLSETELEDYVVVDYGLPITIDMDGFDVLTADSETKITAVGATSDDVNSQSVALTCGTLSLVDGELRYVPTTTDLSAVDTGYFNCIAKVNGSTVICKATVHIVPATNITFEEGFLNFTDANGAAWSEQGTAIEAMQSSENSNYGYDAAYALTAGSMDSLGSSMMTTVSDPLVQPQTEFTFTGDGFDILSRTGADSGVMLVEIRMDGILKRILIVDTYLNGETLYQLPIVHQLLDEYGTYTVTVKAYYNIVFDHTLRTNRKLDLDELRQQLGYPEDVELVYQKANGTTVVDPAKRTPATATTGQYNIYIDGIRIYNPLGNELTSYDGVAYTAYAEAGELNPTYVQIRSNLLSSENWGGSGEAQGAIAAEGDAGYNPESDGAVYLAGTDSTINRSSLQVSRSGIYLSSTGQLKADADGRLLDANDKVITITVIPYINDVYYYSGEITEQEVDGKTVYTDENGLEMASRLYYTRNNVRTYLTKLQEKSLNVCYYDDVYNTDSAQNEVYLKNGQAIAFHVSASDYIQISVKSPNGLPAQLCVYDTARSCWEILNAVSGGMEQYVNISDWIQNGTCIVKCAATDPSAILSIVNVKITSEDAMPMRVYSSLPLIYEATRALANETSETPTVHTHDYVRQIETPATCTQDGTEKMVCSCGDSYEEVLPKLGHDETSELTTAVTCLSDGARTYTCSRCGQTRTQSVKSRGMHGWTDCVVTQSLTCTHNGELVYTCVECGAERHETLTATGHVWNDGEITTPVTCEADGVKTYTCSECGETRTETIPATGHAWNDGEITTPATCEADGVKTYTCANCGQTKTEAIPATGHAWNDGEITTPITCETDGEKTYTCANCGETKTEQVAATGHNWNSGEMTTPATCETQGVLTTTCANCGQTKTEAIMATGHAWNDGEITTPVTCEVDGVKTYTCANCGQTKTEAITATGHAWNDGEITTPITCEADGIKTYTCANCGQAKTEAIAATGHAWNDGEITTPITCEADGVKTYTCVNCGQTKTETVAATGHSWNNAEMTTPATCETQGVLTTTCVNCGQTKTEQVAATGHSWNGGEITTPATCTAQGVKTFTCASCGETRTEVLPVIAHTYVNGACSACGAEDPSWVAGEYTDVSADKWYAQAIAYVTKNKLMNGVSDNTFDPEGTMTRAMLVTILWRMEGEPTGGKTKFTDIKTGEWYENAVAWAEANAIVTGMDETTFAPDSEVTREQTVVLFYRYSTYRKWDMTAKSALGAFSDAGDVSAWARDAMQWAVANGFICGMSNGKLNPKNAVTRAQAATILMRMREKTDR